MHLVLVVLCCMDVNGIEHKDSSMTNFSDVSRERALSTQKETVRIGVYNNIIGYLNWQEPWFTTYAAQKCSTNCVFSLDASAVENADVVVFLASTFKRKHPPFPKRAKPTTVFVLHTMEQPLYVPMLNDVGMLRKNFDLIATYNQVRCLYLFCLVTIVTYTAVFSQDPTYPNTGVPSLPLTYFPLHIYEPEYLLTPPLPFSEKDGYGTGNLFHKVKTHIPLPVDFCRG